MKKRVAAIFLCALLLSIIALPFATTNGSVVSAYNPEGKYVYVGGTPIGIAVCAGGLIVIDCGLVITEEGEVSPLEGTGLAKGDVIVEINGQPALSIYQLKDEVEKSANIVRLKVKKASGITVEITVTPALDKLTDSKRLGLIAKEDVGGVGTLTFVTENGRYGALGHHIADGESGLKDQLNSGKLYPISISGVIKGESGKAGGLIANLNRMLTPIGTIEKNTPIGIYGEYNAEVKGDRMRIAERGEAKMGRAQILTTIDGTEPRLYDIDIVKVVSQSESSEKGLVLSVRDKSLIEKTGGIVQGMSGSPILQNGMLIGAVTHVFLGDATRGYGVHSRFMYDNAMASAMQMAA